MAKSTKSIAIAATVVFLALCMNMYSAERDDAAPAQVTSIPPRVVRIPPQTVQALEEEAPIPRPAPRTPPRTPARTPSRRSPTRPKTTPTRPTTPSRAPSRRVRPPQDPHKDAVILVEAFMVQARLSALYSMDVPQISSQCKSVTAEHILKLLKTTDAAVLTAGAKLALVQGNKAKTDATARQSILSGPPEKRRTVFVEIGTRFTAMAEVRRDDKIFVNLEFEHSAIEERNDSDDSGTIVERKWSTSVYVQAGKPTLVGATQDKEIAAFLIVTANIKK